MKKLLTTLSLLTVVSLALGQGTVNFSNNALYPISINANPEGGPVSVIPTTPGFVTFQLWYGATAQSLTPLSGVLGVNSTTAAGVIASSVDGRSPLSLVAIPGFAPNTQPFIQIHAWRNDAMWVGSTPIIQTSPLGLTTGPAIAIWQSMAGTSPNRFKPSAFLVPEPSSLGLTGLGLAALLLRRKSPKRG